MKYKIVADSSADAVTLKLPIPFESVPLKIITDDKEFCDDKNLFVKGMVNHLMRYKGKTTTACPSVADYLKAFEGSERVICITITGTLSGSYNAACIAKQEYETTHKNSKVYVLNSLSAGPHLKLLIEKASQLINSGVDFESICSELKYYARKKTGLMFTLESLNNLARNGRVSPVIAKTAGLLGIRVVGKASEKGDLEQLEKARGAQKAYKTVVSHLISEGYDGGKLIIDHCFNHDGAKTIKDLVLDKFKNAEISISTTFGLCSFYAENGGMLIGFEKN